MGLGLRELVLRDDASNRLLTFAGIQGDWHIPSQFDRLVRSGMKDNRVVKITSLTLNLGCTRGDSIPRFDKKYW